MYIDPSILTGIGIGTIAGSLVTGVINLLIRRQDRIDNDRITMRRYEQELALAELNQSRVADLAIASHGREVVSKRSEIKRSMLEAAALEFHQGFLLLQVYAAAIVALRQAWGDPQRYKFALDEAGVRHGGSVEGIQKIASALVKPGLYGYPFEELRDVGVPVLDFTPIAEIVTSTTDPAAISGEQVQGAFKALNDSYGRVMEIFSRWVQKELP